MLKKLTITSLLLAAVALVSPAQEQSGATVTLSLDECIKIALSDNPTIKVDSMEVDRVNYARKEVLGQLFPSIDFSASYTRNLALQTMYMDTGTGEATGIKMGRDNTHSVGFSASMPLINASLWKSIKVSDAQILQTLETARANKLSLVNQIKNAYYALLLAKDSKKVIEQNHGTAKIQADIYQKQYEIGTASEYDVLRSNVAVINLEPSLLEAENSISQLKLQLKMLMGMDSRVDIDTNQSLEDFKSRMYERALDTDTSLVNNTSLKALDLQTDYLQKSLDVQKMSWFPTLSASADYMWNSMSNGSPFKNFMWSSSSSVGLSLSFPLFQGGQRWNKQKQAEISLREQTWQRQDLLNSLNTQVQVQLDNLNKNLKQIESSEAGVRQAVKASEIMNKSFTIGSATFIELRDSDDSLMDARLSYYQAIYDYLVADSDLEYLLGNTKYVN